MSRKVAVTGGTGFVGAAVIDALLESGARVTALARDPSRLARAGDLNVIRGDLRDKSSLMKLVSGADAVIHCAGLVKARRAAEFFNINAEGARAVAEAASTARAKLVHISSLAARRPELSAYAASKRASEAAVAEASGDNPWIALRAPAIYGPGDQATLPYFRLVKSGIAPEPAAKPAPRASILFVEDVARAILNALDAAPPRRVYEIGDEAPEGHSWREIGEALAASMNRRAARLPAPRFILSSYAAIGAGFSLLRGEAPMVTPGKIREFFHPDWVARDNLLSKATDWRPATPLKEGFAKTVRWYQENGLL
ncbi:MAG: SDR family NAD(P)-dependent oxidoreductase [Alphaproteobacteria bacterium]|nr:SDR family NAD(P)-dependent oxidoreductase [Alphaproteobacteria bacterium]